MQFSLEYQGYETYKNILYQGNGSTIILENNDNNSSRNQTFDFNICYFFLIDQDEEGNLYITYRPTLEISSVSLLWDTNMFRPKTL